MFVDMRSNKCYDIMLVVSWVVLLKCNLPQSPKWKILKFGEEKISLNWQLNPEGFRLVD